MPRKRKLNLEDITIEDAFSVFQRHGLQVKVEKAEELAKSALADFLETPEQPAAKAVERVSAKKVRITLYAQHTIACAGDLKVVDGEKKIVGENLATYGPGVVTVPESIAAQLLHQDGLARQADDNMLDRRMHTRVVIPHGGSYRLVEVSQDSSFDLSTFLGRLGDNNMIKL